MLFFTIQTDYTRKRWGDSNEQTDIKNRCNATHHSPQRNQMSPAVFKQRNVAQFHTIRPKRKEPLIKAGSHNRNTHTHTDNNYSPKQKKTPLTQQCTAEKELHIYGNKRSSSPTDHATVAMLPRQPKILSLIDISLTATGFFLRGRTAGARVYSIMLRRVLSITKGPQKQTVFFVCLFVCLFVCQPSPKKTETKKISTLPTQHIKSF